MVKVESFSFDSIIVGGKKYRRDLVLLPDGTVKQRKGGFWIFGSHNLKIKEIEVVEGRCRGDRDWNRYKC